MQRKIAKNREHKMKKIYLVDLRLGIFVYTFLLTYLTFVTWVKRLVQLNKMCL